MSICTSSTNADNFMPYKNKADERKNYHKNAERERANKRAYYERNKELCKQRARAQRQTPEYKAIQPHRSRVSLLKRRYNITIADYDRMLIEQNNCCAICSRSALEVLKKYGVKFLDIDHDHETGIVRGLLCRECNVLLGQLEKPKNIIQLAFEYIEKNKILHLEFDRK